MRRDSCAWVAAVFNLQTADTVRITTFLHAIFAGTSRQISSQPSGLSHSVVEFVSHLRWVVTKSDLVHLETSRKIDAVTRLVKFCPQVVYRMPLANPQPWVEGLSV